MYQIYSLERILSINIKICLVYIPAYIAICSWNSHVFDTFVKDSQGIFIEISGHCTGEKQTTVLIVFSLPLFLFLPLPLLSPSPKSLSDSIQFSIPSSFMCSFCVWIPHGMCNNRKKIQTLCAQHGNVSCGLRRYAWEYHVAITQYEHKRALYWKPLPNNRQAIPVRSSNLVHYIYFDCKIMISPPKNDNFFTLTPNPKNRYAL